MMRFLAVLLFSSVLVCTVSSFAWGGERAAFDVAHAPGKGDAMEIDTRVIGDGAPGASGFTEDLRQQAWEPVARERSLVGLAERARSVRATLVNSSDVVRTGWIQVSRPFTDRIDCFVSSGELPAQVYRMGDHLPFGTRPVHATDFLVPITVTPGQQTELVCAIRNDGVLVAELKYWEPQTYVQVTERQATVRVAAYGALLFALLAGGVMAVVNRGAMAFLLVIDLVPALLGSLSVEGDGFRYLWPDSPALNVPPYHWVLLGLAAETVIVWYCFELRAREKAFLLASGVGALLVSAYCAAGGPHHEYGVVVALAQGMFYGPAFLWLCLKHWREGPMAVALSIGIGLQALALWVSALGALDLMPLAGGMPHIQMVSLAASVLKGVMLAMAASLTARQDRIVRANLHRAYTDELCQKLEYEQRVTSMLLRDPLYAQPNQRALEDALHRADWIVGGTVTVWMMRLNHMSVLQSLVPIDVLREAVRAQISRLAQHLTNDLHLTLVSVSDGEAIAVLGDDVLAFCSVGTVHPDVARQLSEHMLARLPWKDMHFAWDPHVGVASLTAGEARSDLFTKARLALNRCTPHYRVQLYVEERMKREQLLQGLTMDIAGAIERGELELHYQPKLALATLETDSFEALVRWRHPLKGLIPPGAFIAEAEATGAIHRLTMWAIQEAARFSRGLTGRHVRVAVNMSAFDLATPGFEQAVLETLAREQVSPDRLILEVTESVAVADTSSSRHVLQRLRESGIQIALDDFGTGQSSLCMLDELPVDEIKVDRSLILGLKNSPTKQAVVRSVIDLARRLGLSVTVEGIEEAWLANWLLAAGADVVQGFYFSRPLPASDALAWCERPITPMESSETNCTGRPISSAEGSGVQLA